MNEILVSFFTHHRWSTLRLLDACERLSEHHLDYTPGGTYGSIRATLQHLLAAEERYVTLLTGEPAPEPLHESHAFPGFARLRASAERSGAALMAIAAQAEAAAHLTGEFQGKPYTMPLLIPLIQAIHHAVEHRTHITTLMGQQGLEPPDLSAWAYGEESG